MRYRLVGEETWTNGVTVNISHSGVLFHGEHSVEPEAVIDLDLALPGEMADGAHLLAHGVVVRKTAPAAIDALLALSRAGGLDRVAGTAMKMDSRRANPSVSLSPR